ERSSVNSQPAIVDLAELLDQVAVFRDRSHAGEILAGMLDSFRNTEAIVLAIPTGGKITTLLVAIDLCLPAIGFASGECRAGSGKAGGAFTRNGGVPAKDAAQKRTSLTKRNRHNRNSITGKLDYGEQG
ncbi:MAG: hypothetical protein HWN70_07600, partial [Desulfobacterales bacterium]|nr:hypothetical protein [Desulfobacterales bacterium]